MGTLISLCISASLLAALLPRVALALEQESSPVQAFHGESAEPADRSAIRVPFDLYGNNILVQIAINNSQPLWFVFDTGASVNVINERVAKRLGLTSKDRTNLAANGGMTSGSLIENTTINLAGVKATNQTIFAVPLDALAEYSGRDVQGLIGNNFIQNFVVEIDYANRWLIFHNPRSYNLANNPDSIELETHDGNRFIKADLSLDGSAFITGSFEIDTGESGSVSINQPFAEKNQVRKGIPKASISEGAGGAGVGGETKYLDARIRSVRLGGYTVNKPIISISQDTVGLGAGAQAGFIGTALLRRFTVILDYQSQRMLLRPNAALNEPFLVDLSGLELVTEANNFKIIKIKQVRAHLPAAKAGLREGDIIVTVNDRSAADYGLDKLSKMFSRDGKEYRLTVKRGHKLILTKLRLKKII